MNIYLHIFLVTLLFIPILKIFLILLRTIFSVIPTKRDSKISDSDTENKPSKIYIFFNWTNKNLGKIEYYIRTLRNYLILIICIPLVSTYFLNSTLAYDLNFLGLLFYISMSLISIREFKDISPKIGDFLTRFPRISPKEFFDHIHAQFGPFKSFIHEKNTYTEVSPESLSFQKMKRQRQLLLPNIKGFFDTCYLAYLCLHCLSIIGPKYCTTIFDLAASMWGKRILEGLRAKLTVSGRKKLENLSGKVILIMNHKSSLDFSLFHFVLSDIKINRDRFLKPRFIAAKEHFKSFFIYNLLGVGKVIEAVGMVFIDRVTKKSNSAHAQLIQASQSLSREEVDIAIFPQGTRAEGNLDRSGKRRDAGYYTTFTPSSLDNDLGHLKKGTAFLALNTLFELQKEKKSDPVHLVFIGIEGTATAMSKQSYKIQTETEIQFNIGEVYTLEQSLIKDIKFPHEKLDSSDPEFQDYFDLVSKIHQEIDEKLVNSIHIKESLIHRFYLELNGNLRYPNERIEIIKSRIHALDSISNIVYQILDRIFACPANYWNANLTKLAQTLLEENPVKRLQDLRIEISQLMLKHLQKKAHGKKVKIKD